MNGTMFKLLASIATVASIVQTVNAQTHLRIFLHKLPDKNLALRSENDDPVRVEFSRVRDESLAQVGPQILELDAVVANGIYDADVPAGIFDGVDTLAVRIVFSVQNELQRTESTTNSLGGIILEKNKSLELHVVVPQPQVWGCIPFSPQKGFATVTKPLSKNWTGSTARKHEATSHTRSSPAGNDRRVIQSELRKWTNVDGKTADAKLRSIVNGVAVFERENGQLATCSLQRLSVKDLEWIRSRQATRDSTALLEVVK